MPKALSTGVKFSFVLDSDLETDPQPTFLVNAVSANKSLDLVERFEQLDPRKKEDLPKVLELFKGLVVGWQDMKDPETGACIEFSVEAIADVCDCREMTELFYGVVAGRVKAIEKKN